MGSSSEPIPSTAGGKSAHLTVLSAAAISRISNKRDGATRDASEVGVTERRGRCLKMMLPTGGLLGGAARIGEFPEDVQRLLDLAGKGDRIECLELRRERGALGGREDAGGEDALIRRLGRIVAFAEPAADAALAHELADGAEEVVLQPEQPVEPLEHRPGGPGAVAIVADEPADEQAVALLDPGLIVLAVGAAAGEAHSPTLAPAEQGGVDELAAVVAVPRAYGEGQPERDVLNR